jgi:quinol monooxygenase YgiN
MAEVVVVVQFRAAPGRAGEAEAAFAEVVPATHAEEGCVVFAVHRVAGDPDRFVLVERWASREALDAHLATPHLAAFRARGADIWAEPPQLTVAAGTLPVGDPAKGSLAGA